MNNSEPIFRAWITKYAISEGIYEIDARVCSPVSQTMIEHVGKSNIYFHNDDWHRTRESAVARAEEMRKAKIASLRKQIAKLEKKVF
jgi:uncharacterized membrane protein